MGKTHISRKIDDPLSILEDLGGHAIALALKYPASLGASRDTASILATMLEVVQTLV